MIIVPLKDENGNTIPMRTERMSDDSVAFAHVVLEKSLVASSRNEVTTGGVQEVAAENFSRQKLRINNMSDMDMWITEDGSTPAVGVGFKLTPSSFAEISSGMTVNLFCSVAGRAFYVVEYE